MVENKNIFNIASMQIGFNKEKASHIPVYAVSDCGGGIYLHLNQHYMLIYFDFLVVKIH